MDYVIGEVEQKPGKTAQRKHAKRVLKLLVPHRWIALFGGFNSPAVETVSVWWHVQWKQIRRAIRTRRIEESRHQPFDILHACPRSLVTILHDRAIVLFEPCGGPLRAGSRQDFGS